MPESFCFRIQGKDKEGPGTRSVRSVAEVMSRAFIGLYKSVVRHFEGLMGADPTVNFQAQIAQLEEKVSILEQFLETLQDGNN